MRKDTEKNWQKGYIYIGFAIAVSVRFQPPAHILKVNPNAVYVAIFYAHDCKGTMPSYDPPGTEMGRIPGI